MNKIDWPSSGRKKLTTKWQLEVEENIAGLVKTMRKSVFSVKTRFLKRTWKGISQVCWREVKNSLFPSDTLIYGICRDGSKNYNIRTCEHMPRGQLRMWARATINVALMGSIPRTRPQLWWVTLESIPRTRRRLWVTLWEGWLVIGSSWFRQELYLPDPFQSA